MKKWRFPKIKFRKVDISSIDDKTLLLNLYITQAVTLILGILIIFLQQQAWNKLFNFQQMTTIIIWGTGFAGVVLLVDWLIARWVPEEVSDDGGVNNKLFAKRPLWHIALISLVVAICEELLFRGAIQHSWGPYWTSILFAAIHVRYLQHWLMTGMVFGISYGLGWMYIYTGSLLTPILAHFVIDMIMGCIIRHRGKKDES